LLKIINQYLDNYESESDHPDPMFGGNSLADPKARLLMENLELLNELECPTLELIEVPKVKLKIEKNTFEIDCVEFISR
jgi:hypothetical protein